MSEVLQAFSYGPSHVPVRGGPPGRRWRLRGQAGGLQCCL